MSWIFEFDDGKVIIDGPPFIYETLLSKDKRFLTVVYKNLYFTGRLIKVSIQ